MQKNKGFPGLLRMEFEHFVDHAIPWLVIMLAIVLLLENPFWTLVHLEEFEPWITVFDSAVVAIFVLDLVFKWQKTRNIRKFLKLYWLDLAAVFPFYLCFRAYAELATIFRLGEEVAETGQKVAHEAILLREAEVIGKEARAAQEARVIGRAIRAVQRFLRLLKGRLYASHKALMEIHKRHKREHKNG